MAERSTLPLPDYDQLPIGGLESRVRALTADEVEELLTYEKEHAHRVPVTELLTARLEQLRSGAEPTSGDPAAVRPERAGQPGAGSSVSPATSPEPQSPPPHGTPDQRGRPKGNRST
jgi:hypothetical protein